MCSKKNLHNLTLYKCNKLRYESIYAWTYHLITQHFSLSIGTCKYLFYQFLLGYNVTDVLSSPSIGKIQNGTTLVFSDEFTRIDCAISHQTDSVEWYYRFQLGDNATLHPKNATTFSIETGMSSLYVDSLQPGYYSCVINADMIYSFISADRSSLGRYLVD